MKYTIILILCCCCIKTYCQADLVWNSATPIWTIGNTSNTYTNIGSPSIPTLSVAYSGDITGTFQSNFPRATANGLASGVNFTSNTQCVTITLTFSVGVSSLSFNIVDIDKDATPNADGTFGYTDQVTINGSINGTASNPTIGANAVTSVSGNTITGTGSGANLTNSISFTNPVDKVVITYCNASGTQSNPTIQSMTIGALTWAGPLPVKLISFNGLQEDNFINLSWETASEINNDGFEIERSINAIDFVKIGTQAGNGTTNQNVFYHFIDANPDNGTNYYRLKQKDFNGSFEYSKIIDIQFNRNSNDLFSYSSPTSDVLKIAGNLENAEIQLIDSKGNKIQNHQIISRQTEFQLSTNRLNTGVYFLWILQQNHSNIKKIFIE